MRGTQNSSLIDVQHLLAHLQNFLPAKAHDSQPNDDFSGEGRWSELGTYHKLVCKNSKLFIANCEHRKYGQIGEPLDF